jgi:hypothetical protein
MTRQQRIRQRTRAAVQDLIADLLYYGRKEDEDLKLGEIEEAIRLGTFSADDVVAWFRSELAARLTETM